MLLKKDFEIYCNLEFLVIGDIHFSIQTPNSRIDNYFKTCLSKLEFVLDYAISHNVCCVFFEGDFFNRINEPIQCLSNIIALINKKTNEFYNVNKTKLNLFSIVGNHDLPYENFKFIERSPLYLLFETGVLNHFKSVKLFNENNYIVINGFDYSENITKASTKNSCCIAHCFYGTDCSVALTNNSYCDRITYEESQELEYSVYFLGHDHVYYGITKNNNVYVVRSGSLLRNSSHSHQTNRIPCFYHVKFDNNIYLFSQIDVTIAAKGEAVFTHEALTKPKQEELNSSVKSKIADIISILGQEEQQDDSILNILNNILKEKNINNEVKSLLYSYFSRENLI